MDKLIALKEAYAISELLTKPQNFGLQYNTKQQTMAKFEERNQTKRKENRCKNYGTCLNTI